MKRWVVFEMAGKRLIWGELRGREKPDEIVVVSGHLDSWDVGAGATDDGGGCIVTWEALRIMKKLNLRPRRTVRVVLVLQMGNRRGPHGRELRVVVPVLLQVRVVVALGNL